MKINFEENTLGAYNPHWVVLPQGLARLNLYIKKAKRARCCVEGRGPIHEEGIPPHWEYRVVGLQDEKDGQHVGVVLLPESEEENKMLKDGILFVRSLKHEMEIVLIPMLVLYDDIKETLEDTDDRKAA